MTLTDYMCLEKKVGRGLASIENSVDAKDYIEKHRERLITATKNNTDNTRTNITTITRKQKWEKNNSIDVLSDK